MKNPIKTLLDRDERRWQSHGIKDWERRREEGQFIFVLKFALRWCLMMIIAFTLLDYLFDGRIRFETLWFRVLGFLIVGLAVGTVFWHKVERKFQKYLSEEKISKILKRKI